MDDLLSLNFRFGCLIRLFRLPMVLCFFVAIVFSSVIGYMARLSAQTVKTTKLTCGPVATSLRKSEAARMR
jgi:hypothetical protein